MFRRFIAANRRLAAAIEQCLPQRRLDISRLYDITIARHLRGLPAGAVIVDAGGGRRSAVREHQPAGTRLVAVDESASELALNRDVDETRIADISRLLPFADGEVDAVCSKHVLEHLPAISGFVAEAARVLKPGGVFIAFFPARYAPFATINRLLPDRIKRRLLYSLHPETEGTPRFRAFYDHCYCTAIVQLLGHHGFDVEEVTASYYQSHYFGFFLPLYLLSAGYELVPYAAGLKDLAASLLVVARKPFG